MVLYLSRIREWMLGASGCMDRTICRFIEMAFYHVKTDIKAAKNIACSFFHRKKEVLIVYFSYLCPLKTT